MSTLENSEIPENPATSNNSDNAETLKTNETIEILLNRRSIRKFKDEAIDDETVASIESATQHAASSQYLNDWSAIRVKEQSIKDRIAENGHQAYIAEAPLLYIFVADEHRNAAIAERQGVDIHSDDFTLNSVYRLVQSHNDAVLALHSMEMAAASFGLGSVILGTVLNNTPELIDLLKLPEFTYPVLGLAIGKPDQKPMRKPRMQRPSQFFDNTYPADSETLEGLNKFDETVHKYYDLRSGERLDTFSDQIREHATDRGVFDLAITKFAEQQGFRFDR